MKNYKDSDYALNKYSNGIVYRFDGQIVEITLEDYLAEKSGRTEEDFRTLKALSDADYLDQARAENAQTKKNVSLSDVVTTELCMAFSPETVIFDAPEESGKNLQRLHIAKCALDKLTDVQRRRYLLHNVSGLSTRKIAKLEGVAQRSVMDSLQFAESKIKKVLANMANG